MENLFNTTPLEDFIFCVLFIQFCVAIGSLIGLIILLLKNSILYIKGITVDRREKMGALYLLFYIIYPLFKIFILAILEKQNDNDPIIAALILGLILYAYIVYRSILLLMTDNEDA